MNFTEATLSIRVLGGPSIGFAQDDVVKLPTRKAEGLLCYLVERQGVAVPREVLADLLWPLSAEEQARASLRQEILVLHKALGPALADNITTHGDRVQLATHRIDADIWDFRAGSQDVVQLLDMYRGPFLDSFRIKSQPFNDWVLSTRSALETHVLDLGTAALAKLAGAQRMISSALQLGPEHDETQARGIEFNLSPNETAPADPLVEPRHALVGRDAEVEHLTNSLRQALDEQGSVVSLRGEPGEGKSRLVHETSKVAMIWVLMSRCFKGTRPTRMRHSHRY